MKHLLRRLAEYIKSKIVEEIRAINSQEFYENLRKSIEENVNAGIPLDDEFVEKWKGKYKQTVKRIFISTPRSIGKSDFYKNLMEFEPAKTRFLSKELMEKYGKSLDEYLEAASRTYGIFPKMKWTPKSPEGEIRDEFRKRIAKAYGIDGGIKVDYVVEDEFVEFMNKIETRDPFGNKIVDTEYVTVEFNEDEDEVEIIKGYFTIKRDEDEC